MASKEFFAKQTIIDAEWLNCVDRHVVGSGATSTCPADANLHNYEDFQDTNNVISEILNGSTIEGFTSQTGCGYNIVYVPDGENINVNEGCFFVIENSDFTTVSITGTPSSNLWTDRIFVYFNDSYTKIDSLNLKEPYTANEPYDQNNTYRKGTLLELTYGVDGRWQDRKYRAGRPEYEVRFLPICTQGLTGNFYIGNPGGGSLGMAKLVVQLDMTWWGSKFYVDSSTLQNVYPYQSVFANGTDSLRITFDSNGDAFWRLAGTGYEEFFPLDPSIISKRIKLTYVYDSVGPHIDLYIDGTKIFDADGISDRQTTMTTYQIFGTTANNSPNNSLNAYLYNFIIRNGVTYAESEFTTDLGTFWLPYRPGSGSEGRYDQIVNPAYGYLGKAWFPRIADAWNARNVEDFTAFPGATPPAINGNASWYELHAIPTEDGLEHPEKYFAGNMPVSNYGS